MSFRYAGFGIRAIAESIDLALLVGVSSGIELIGLRGMYEIRVTNAGARRAFADAFDPMMLQASTVAVFLVCMLFYFSLAHYAWGATVGKRLLRVRVVRSDGGEISLGQSLLRTAASFLSMALLGAGYWLAAFDPLKRTLHDLAAKTIVVVRAEPS